MSDHFERIAELFEALRSRSADDREHFLSEAAAEVGDDAVAEVRILLAQHDLGEGTLDTPCTPPDPRIAMPKKIGRYKIISLLGRGGMGVVYKARQQNPARDVAIKMIQSGLTNIELRRRFELEAAVLGRLQHPGIAQIHEAGVQETEQGALPFFVMELIDGLPLRDYVQQQSLNQDARLQLFQQICDAIQHAHQRGVIHRDLKPSNILVTASGQIKVLDFGVARTTDSDLQATSHTATGQLIGTLAYMSPEQVTGRAHQVDARSDVYALGVLLYELLAGRLPHALPCDSILAAARVISEDDPTPLTTISRAYRGDLNTIVLTALDKERERRYPSAADLSADVQRFLNDEPIVARPASTVYQIRKFAKRNKGLVTGLAAAFAILLLGIATTSVQAIRATRQKEAAESEARFANEISNFYQQILTSVDTRWSGADAKITDALSRAESKLDENPPSARVESHLRRAIGDAYIRLGLYERAEIQESLALQKAEAHYGRKAFATMKVLNQLAQAHCHLARFDEAEREYRELVEFMRAAGPNAEEELILAIDGLAQLLSLMDRNEEALPLARESLARFRNADDATFDDANEAAMLLLATLSTILYRQGELDEAEQLAQEAVDLATNVWGDRSAHLQEPLNLLAIIYESSGRYEEAITKFRRIAEIIAGTLPDDHPTIGIQHVNLGMSLQGAGKWDEAETEFRQAGELFERTLGRDHPYTLAALAALGNLLQRADRMEEAEPILKEVLATRQRVLGEGHRDTMSSVWHLRNWYRKRAEFDKAVALLKPQLDLHITRDGRDDAGTISVLYAYASDLFDAGQIEEALPLLRETYEFQLDALGPDHDTTSKVRKQLGEALQATGQTEEAAALKQP